MKIVVATTAPTFWGPQAECIARTLRERGHEATAVSSPGADSCDVLFCIGSGESLLPFLDAAPEAAKVLYLIEAVPTPDEADDFTRAKRAIHRDYLRRFQVALVHTNRSAPILRELGVPRVRPKVWPHFPTIWSPQSNVPKDLDVLFVGTSSPYRREILQIARKRHRVAVAQGVFHAEAAALYRRAKVALNVHFTPLRNFECRVVEALGCGAFLLSQPLDPPHLLLDGKHLVAFAPDTLSELLDRYLADDAERERIAAAGHAEIQRYAVSARAGDLEGAALEALAVRKATPSSPARPPGSRRSRASVDGREWEVLHPAGPAFQYVVDEVFLRGAYPVLPLLRKESGAILDVGANVGLTAVWFRALYPNATVYAIEPGSEAFSYLQINARSLGDVRVFRLALLDRDGSADLHRGDRSCATASLFGGAQTTAHSERVPLRRASSFVAEQGIDRILLLKIDAEGAEVPILRDLAEVLSRTQAVQLEYHSEADRLEIDRLLAGRFVLYQSRAEQPHRGTLSYVANSLLARSNAGDWAIQRDAPASTPPEAQEKR